MSYKELCRQVVDQIKAVEKEARKLDLPVNVRKSAGIAKRAAHTAVDLDREEVYKDKLPVIALYLIQLEEAMSSASPIKEVELDHRLDPPTDGSSVPTERTRTTG